MASRASLNFLLRRILPALAVGALLVASLKLAEDASGDSARFAAHYRWVLAAAGVALVALAIAIGLRLWRLHRDVARGTPGARLNRRLLMLLTLLAVPSTVVVYGFALRFVDATIDNWFNVRLEQALEDALELGRIVVDEHLRAAETSTTALAQRLAEEPAESAQASIDEAIDALGAIQLALFGADGRVQASASSDPRYLDPPLPDGVLLMRVQGEGRYAAAEPLGDALALRVVVQVAGGGDRLRPLPPRLLQGLFPLQSPNETRPTDEWRIPLPHWDIAPAGLAGTRDQDCMRANDCAPAGYGNGSALMLDWPLTAPGAVAMNGYVSDSTPSFWDTLGPFLLLIPPGLAMLILFERIYQESKKPQELNDNGEDKLISALRWFKAICIATVTYVAALGVFLLYRAVTGINALLDGMARFGGAAGAMERQSQSLLGVFSTFKDTVALSLTNSFQPAIPAIKDALARLTPVIGSALDELGPALGATLTAALPLIGQLVQGLVPILTPVLSLLTGFITALGDSGVLQTFGEAIGGLLAPLADLGPMLGIVVAALVPALVGLIEAFRPLLDAVLPVLGELIRPLVPIVLLFVFLQRYLVQGVAESGLKG